MMRILIAALCVLTMSLPAVAPVQAASGDRTIYLYYTHTKETGKFTFRKNGRYDKKVLAELNTFLRDWRRNEPAEMDPRLFDLIWEVYQEAGAKKPVHVVSAYRAPATNEMLRKRSSAVAKNSRHTMGMAMDFFIPGIKISRLREIAMRKQVGGVGYYPASGSPFVHLDTGNVRAWPRMTRNQLAKIFPDGKTLHIPADGKLLSDKGYKLAKAEWTKCRSVPCGRSLSSSTRVASNDSSSGGNGKTLMDWFFGEDEGDDGDNVEVATVADTGPARRSVSAVPVVAPVPAMRPSSLAVVQVADAPLPAARPEILLEDSTAQPNITVASIDPAIPQPRALISQGVEGRNNPNLTAYAPVTEPEPDAQRALQMLIEERLKEDGSTQKAVTTAASEPSLLEDLPELEPVTYEVASDSIRTASIGTDNDALGSLIENTWTSITRSGAPAESPAEPVALIKAETRAVDLIAPGFDHVTEIFADPARMHSNRYAVIFEPDAADLDPAISLGRYGRQVAFSRTGDAMLPADAFAQRAPILSSIR